MINLPSESTGTANLSGSPDTKDEIPRIPSPKIMRQNIIQQRRLVCLLSSLGPLMRFLSSGLP